MALTLYVHPGSYSCWCVEVLLSELSTDYEKVVIDLHVGDQFKPEFLALSPRGTVPVLKTVDQVYVGPDRIREFLKSRTEHTNADIFKGDVDLFMSKLDSAPIGLITYGLAFHQGYTKILRYPYGRQDFLETATNYILTRASKLEEAALASNDPEVTQELLEASAAHQAKLPTYLEDSQYDSSLRMVSNLLTYFEGELERDRAGLWLGGIYFSVADITLGLLLHRIWQLGMENEMFEDGVRPHLSLYYNRLKKRESFRKVTSIDTQLEVRHLKSSEDKFVDNAKLGVGMMLLMGGLYIGKKFMKK